MEKTFKHSSTKIGKYKIEKSEPFVSFVIFVVTQNVRRTEQHWSDCSQGILKIENPRLETRNYSVPFCVHHGTIEPIRQRAPTLLR